MDLAIDRTYLYDRIKTIYSEIHDQNNCSSSKINFGEPSLKLKQLRYLPFLSEQLSGEECCWVYSYIILEDEC